MFDDEVESVALAPRFTLGLLEQYEVAREFFVGSAQVGHVAEDGDEADALAARVQSGSGDDLEVYVRAFERVYENEVATDDLFRRDRRARKVGGEQEIVHLKRAPLALARVASVAEEFFGASVLEEDFVVHVREHDGVGHTLHDGLDPLALALKLADACVEALDLNSVGEDDADAVGVARQQVELRLVQLFARRADVERAHAERLREPRALIVGRAEGCAARAAPRL